MTDRDTPAPTRPMATPYVLPFAGIRARDLPMVGGKGANLGEMAAAGFPVPPGFCVTTAAFQAFLDADPNVEDIFAALATVEPENLDTLRRAGRQVREHLRAVAMPPDVASAVLAIWRSMGPAHAYAVRSSATAEDLPGASFAGQQDTYLNVRGADDLLANVKNCWISLFTDRAILYRIQNGFDHRAVLLSVVVQRMVEPDVSGILFTADPVSGNRHVASIDASYGLGEALVSGLVSADLYQVDKQNVCEIDAQIADKTIAIWPLPDGGTEQRPVDDSLRRSRALPAPQTLALAALGTRIEAHFGMPQDIEWALVGDELFILQARPITSLYPLPKPAPTDEALHVYVSFGHPQMMTDAMRPMGLSVWQLFLPFGRPSGSLDYNPFVTTAGGRIYLDATPLLLHPLGKQVITRFFTVADQLSAGVLREIVADPAFQAQGKAAGSRASVHGIASWIAPVGRGVFADLWWRNPDGRSQEVSAWMDPIVAEAAADLAAAEPGAARLRVCREVLATRMEPILRNVAHNVGGGFASQLLARKLAGAQADPDDLAAFMRGLSGNVTTEMDLAVGDLADTARESPALVAHLQAHDARTALETLDDVDGGPAFRAQWDQFMAQYGMRGPAEIDITRPRWRDDPASLMQMLLGNLNQREPGAHRSRHAQMATEGEAAASRLAEAAHRGPAGAPRAAIVRRQTRVARNLAPVREHPKYLLVRLLGLVRDALLEAGALLVDAGRVDATEDIWYLDLIEAIHVFEHPDEELRRRIAQRKADLQHFQKLTPPRVMTSDGDIPAVSHKRDDLPEGALAGNPVSAGVVEGLAKVVLDPAVEQVLPGEILVAPFTDPGWTPLFINAAGLVLEVGGLMTHGSVVAREYGIPAVSHRRDDLPEGALAGNPVSAGMVEGLAKVVLDPAVEQVLPGEILVAPFTDPGWTPLFINAAGLVLEVGGLMTHGSVVAREYGIPAVVGVLDATTQIRTGQRLRVSGDEGYVEVLDPEV